MPKLSDFSNPGQGYSLATLTAGEAIAAGDLVTVGADGKAYWSSDPTGASPGLRPISTGAPTSLTISSATAIAAATSHCGSNATAVLSNGNIVTTWISSNNIYFAIWTPALVQVVAPTLAVAAWATTEFLPAVTALSGGGFALLYANSANGYYSLTTYSNAGVLVVSPVVVEAQLAATGHPQMVTLTGGNIALVFANAANATSVRMAVYSSSLTVVAAASLISVAATTIAARDSLAISALTGGGFVVSWVNSRFSVFTAVFTSAGAVSVASYTMGAAASSIATVVNCALSGGGYAVAQTPAISDTANVTVGVYNASGALQSSLISLTATANSTGRIFVTGLVGGSVAVAIQPTDTSVAVNIIAATGSSVGTVTLPVAMATPASLFGLATADGNFTVIYSAASQFYTCATINGVSPAILVAGPTLAITSGGFACGMYSIPPSTATSAYSFGVVSQNTAGTGIAAQAATAAIQKMTFVGVATAAAAASSAVTVQQAGTATIRLALAAPFTLDSRPLGGAVSILGSTATLANGFTSAWVGRSAVNTTVSSTVSYTVPANKTFEGWVGPGANYTVNGSAAIAITAGSQPVVKANAGDVIAATTNTTAITGWLY